MARFYLRTLPEIHKLLALLACKQPVAVFDFFSAEMGYEVLGVQALCGKFRDEHPEHMVVALCWKGSSILYSNVSDIQIELDQARVSMQGNTKHTGIPRYAWLERRGHYRIVRSIEGVTAHIGPSYWAGGSPTARRLQGHIARDYLAPLDTNRLGFIWATLKRLTDSQHIFKAETGRNLPHPYIAIFDRNEIHRKHRNTQEWQVMMLWNEAQRYGLNLVVVAGLYPREWPEGIAQLHPQHRDLDLLCDVVSNSLFYAAPTCGAAEAGLLFGCNFLALGEAKYGHEELVQFATVREFAYLGLLDVPEKISLVEKFLDAEYSSSATE